MIIIHINLPIIILHYLHHSNQKRQPSFQGDIGELVQMEFFLLHTHDIRNQQENVVQILPLMLYYRQNQLLHKHYRNPPIVF
ncbi:hypothetical protein CQ054_10530 [Ochrobactrum sp. MYb29]|nr:hypothetical protein CWE02_01490 [Brucella pituitosa]PRA86637.1 hypothetical protein CQ054_10530 [Ochrobactrum sp. MYb29]